MRFKLQRLSIYFTLIVIFIISNCQISKSNSLTTEMTESKPFFASNTIADIAELVSPTVVNIVAYTTNRVGHSHSDSQNKDESTKRVRRYFGLDTDTPSNSAGVKITGSGVIIKESGYILTSLHGIQNSNEIRVSLHDGRKFEANVVGRDSFSDLAVLKIDAQNLPIAKFGNPNKLRLGEWVVAIGNQFGLEHTITCGLISGLHREAKAYTPSFGARTGALKYIQTDTPINPGSSGGPLVNLVGEIIGINSFIMEDAQNVGFAMPADLAYNIANKLINSGQISRPYIGIEMRDPSELVVDTGQLGVEITKVKSSSPASHAGLEVGDFIYEIDTQLVKSPADVSRLVLNHTVGTDLIMKIKHNGSDRTLVLKLEKLPDILD